jgi:hypothetical protein
LTIPFFNFFNQKIIHAAPTYPVRSLQIYDLAGIAKFSHDVSVFGAQSSLTMPQVSDCYIPAQWDTMATLGKCHIFWDQLALPAGAASTHLPDGGGGKDALNPNLTKMWLTAIARHPIAYLEHRAYHFNSELYFIAPRNQANWRVLFHEVYGAPIDVSEYRTLKGRIMDYVRCNPFSTPVFFLALCSIMLFLSWPKRNAQNFPLRNDIFCLSYSGVIYTLAYFLIGVASDVRYQFWTMLAAFVAFVLYAAEKPQDFFPPSRRGWICIALLALTAAIVLIAQIILGDLLFSAG